MVRRYIVGPAFGATPWQEVNAEIVSNWVLELRSRGHSPQTIRNCHSVASSTWNEAVQAGTAPRNPCLGLAPSKKSHSYEVRSVGCLSPAEQPEPAKPTRQETTNQQHKCRHSKEQTRPLKCAQLTPEERHSVRQQRFPANAEIEGPDLRMRPPRRRSGWSVRAIDRTAGALRRPSGTHGVTAVDEANRVRNGQTRLRRQRIHLRYLGAVATRIALRALRTRAVMLAQVAAPLFYATSTPFTLSNGYTAACSNDCQYLEVQTAQPPGTVAWCVGSGASKLLSPGTGAAIGTGYSNTQTLALPGNCQSGAAYSAKASTSGGYADWFVPSQDEIGALVPPYFPTGNTDCWSSSEDSPQSAWIVDGPSRSFEKAQKTRLTGVCLVRAF